MSDDTITLLVNDGKQLRARAKISGLAGEISRPKLRSAHADAKRRIITYSFVSQYIHTYYIYHIYICHIYIYIYHIYIYISYIYIYHIYIYKDE